VPTENLLRVFQDLVSVDCIAWRIGMAHAARLICSRCAAGDAHHTNARHSIGGSEGRHPVYDLHVAEGGGLAECWAAAIWGELAKSREISDD